MKPVLGFNHNRNNFFAPQFCGEQVFDERFDFVRDRKRFGDVI
jgi:hypothetical protein